MLGRGFHAFLAFCKLPVYFPIRAKEFIHPFAVVFPKQHARFCPTVFMKTIYLNKFESSLLKKLKMFKRHHSIFTISFSSPLEKRHGPPFEYIWVPLTQGCFVQSLMKISTEVLGQFFKRRQCIFHFFKGLGLSLEQS